MGMSKDKKVEYFVRVEELINTYSKLFVVTCDNVGSAQMQNIRLELRPLNTIVLMGKNTMMRKIINGFLEKHPGHPFAAMLDLVKGNVGFIFTNADLTDVRAVIDKNIVPAPARVGAIANVAVTVPPGPTDCDPGQTAFFQALGIATKIVKGRIEITSPVDLLKAGDRVGNSEAAFLQKLNIRPFTYGLIITHIYDSGAIFSPKVLDITPEDLLGGFSSALSNVAGISLGAGFPTMASVPNSMTSAFKTLVSIAVECESCSFEKADAYKAAVAAAK
jgi:large subunit ribosomal protein LP0